MKNFYLLISVLIILVSCNNNYKNLSHSPVNKDSVQIAWETAKSINTIQSYRQFINKYPKSEYAIVAKQKIEQELLWQETLKKNTIEAYRNFCVKYPYSVHRQQAEKNVNKILKNDLNDKYSVMTVFLRQMSVNPSYQTFKQYSSDNISIVKSKRYHSYDKIVDSIQINSKLQFDSYVPKKIFSYTYNSFLNDTTYKLKCLNNGIRMTFLLSCGKVSYDWIKNNNKLTLSKIIIDQDFCDE